MENPPPNVSKKTHSDDSDDNTGDGKGIPPGTYGPGKVLRVSLASQSETNPPEKSNRVSVLFNVCEPFNFCLPIIHSHSLNFRRSLQLQTKQWAPKMGQAVQQEENKIDYCKMCKQPDADDEVLTTLIVCEAEIPSYYNCIGDYGCGKWFHVQCVERMHDDKWIQNSSREHTNEHLPRD